MTRLKRWLSNLLRTEPQLALQYGTTVADFKSDAGRVTKLRELLRHPVARYAFSVVAHALPPNSRYTDANAALFDLGVARGAREALLVLDFLSEPDAGSEPLVETWGVPEEEDKQE